MTGLRDYVVQTRPCFEALAKDNLETLGFDAYLPAVIEEIRTGRLREKRTTVLVPLFPGYVFVRLDLHNAAWRRIASVRGVRGFLGHDSEHPKPLPEHALDDLRARFAAGEFVQRVTTHRVNAGDPVTVTGGAFAGREGVCTVSRDERLKVLLRTFWGAIEVEMPTAMAARAS